jgi:hypothetical protein
MATFSSPRVVLSSFSHASSPFILTEERSLHFQLRRDKGAAIGHSALTSVCGPEANTIAIWYRLRMLGLCDYAGLLSAHKHDGEFTDTVYRVVATFPLKRMEMDVTYQGPPFDVEEFVKQVKRASTE